MPRGTTKLIPRTQPCDSSTSRARISGKTRHRDWYIRAARSERAAGEKHKPSGLAVAVARVAGRPLGCGRGYHHVLSRGGGRLPERRRERVDGPADRGVRAVHVAVEVRHARAAAGGDADREGAHAREEARHAAVPRVPRGKLGAGYARTTAADQFPGRGALGAKRLFRMKPEG